MSRKVFIPVFLVFVVILVTAAISCKDTLDDTATIVFPSSGVSYSKQVDPLFQQRCSISGCHNSTTHSDGLDLSPSISYHNLITYSPLLVVAGDANGSLLYQILTGNNIYPMPPSYVTQLNSNQINGIKTWIKEGAHNN
ncbi:MAG: hypothetical protein WAV76_08555 [Bacteroidota bacterium]